MEHDADLLRELALVRVSADQPEESSVPARLLQIAQEVRDDYGSVGAEPDARMDAAFARGVEHLDVTYTVPADILPFIRRVRQALVDAEEFCRSGNYLLTLAATPDVAAYREWVLDEFERQLTGGSPAPWRRADRAGSTASG